MQSSSLAIIVLTLVLSTSNMLCQRALPEQEQSAKETRVAPKAQQPILLELFTSQGCSSCPPADAVLAKLVAEDLPVIALSYHVDYWNRLGWKDPYSQAQFSERQRQYATKINDRGVYTPQVVVQGQSGHVGSREREIRQVIQQKQQKPSHTGVDVALVSQEKDQLTLAYTLDGAWDNTVLNLALVEKQVANHVPKGENRGRALAHVQVVRDFQSLRPDEAKGELSIQHELLTQDAEQWDLVAFVQKKDSWEVVAVAVLSKD